MAKKLGFALGSGGSRGVAHIGFLMAMEEAGIVPDYIAGTSMGSVVGACYAKGYTPHQMADIVKKLKFSDIFDLSLTPVSNAAILRSEKMNKKLRQYIGAVKFEQLKIPFRCVATDVVNGCIKVFGEDPTDKVYTAVAASSTIPSVFKPVEIHGMPYVDGGVLCRVPTQTVRDMGADIVVAVDVLGKIRPCEKKFNMFTLMTRVFDIADCCITEHTKKKERADIYIEPDLGQMSSYKFKDIDKAIEIGYQTGKAFARKIIVKLNH